MESRQSGSVTIQITKNLSITWDNELMLRIALGIIWASLLLFYARGVVLRLPALKDYVDAVNVAMVLVPVLLSLPAFRCRLTTLDVLLYGIAVCYLVSSYVFFPENASYLDENVLTCVFAVFTYYFVGRVIDIEESFNFFLTLSSICILANLFYYIFYLPQYGSASVTNTYDNMWTAYQTVPHVGFVFWAMMEKFRIWKFLTFVGGLLFLLSCGTRGPLACLALFCLVYFFFFMNFRNALYVKLGIVGFFVIVIMNLQAIVTFVGRIFIELGLSTRILEKFITGDLGNDSDRSVLRDTLESVLNNGSHVWGLGPFGCRNYNVIYPHFLPLDFACTFGYVVGYALLFLISLIIAYAVWKTWGTKAQIFIVFLFCFGFAKLFLSNTFLLEPLFYMLIGVCVKETFFYSRRPSPSMKEKSAV